MSAQLAFAVARDPRDLSDLAPAPLAEARIRRRNREHLAVAMPRTAACSCNGPAVRDEDGDWTCTLCAKPSSADRSLRR